MNFILFYQIELINSASYMEIDSLIVYCEYVQIERDFVKN